LAPSVQQGLAGVGGVGDAKVSVMILQPAEQREVEKHGPGESMSVADIVDW
jgi:hypothetical protein